MFTGSEYGLAAGVLYSGMIAAACASDVRSRRIPNKLVAVLAVAGLLYSMTAPPVWRGGLLALAGLFIGFAIWVPFYAMGILGAGDVKLFAAAAAWLRPVGTLEAAAIAAIAGAVLSVIWLFAERGARGAGRAIWIAYVQPLSLANRPSVERTRRRFPYGVALAIGLLVAAWLPGMIL
jgi:prepilin peptidase CpaA